MRTRRTSPSELEDLRAIGDELQSAASRLAEWVGAVKSIVPYEVRLAGLEAEDAVDRWTEVRKGAR